MIQKIKKLFSFLKSKGAERGLAFIPILIVIGIVTLLGVGIYEIEKFRTFIGEVGYQVAKGLSWVLLPLSQYLAKMACTLLQNVLALDFMAKPITKDPVIIESVKFVRDFANMFIVLGFVVVAIATTLRIMEYGAQKLLFPLIAIAILVNFSSVLCGLFIDVANIFMKYFLDAGAAGVIQQYDFKSGDKNDVEFQAKLKEFMALKDAGTVKFLGLIYGMAFFNFIIFGVFLYLSIMLIVRQTMLMVLVILAPLAFVFFVFGFTKKYFKMWWEQFLAWNLFGVIMLFFAYLAARMIGAGTLAGGPEAGEVNLLGFFVPMIFLLVGYKISRSMGMMGADAAIGLAKGAGLAVISGGAALAGATATRLGSAMKESKTGQAVGGAMGRTMEAMGFQKKGTEAQKKEGRGQEALKRTKAQYAEKGGQEKMDKALAGRGAMPPEDRAAWAALAAGEGKIDRSNPQHLDNLARAESYGFNRSDWEKKDPNLAAHNQRKVTGLMSTKGLKEPQAQAEAVKQSVRKMSPSEFRRNVTSPNAYTPAVFSSMTGAQINDVYRHGSQTQKDALGQMVTTKRKGTSEYSKMLKKEGRHEERADLAKNIRNVRAQLMPPTSPRQPRSKKTP